MFTGNNTCDSRTKTTFLPNQRSRGGLDPKIPLSGSIHPHVVNCFGGDWHTQATCISIFRFRRVISLSIQFNKMIANLLQIKILEKAKLARKCSHFETLQ
jgi:hypothetical protein